MKEVLELKNVSKILNNNKILNNINFKFQAGNIYGVKGKNGSGKTVLLKVISGIMYPTTGDILIDNKSYLKNKGFLESTGIIIEYPGFMKDETGFNNLKYLASINAKISDKEIEDAILKVGLDPKDKRKVKKYSLGMKQRLGIAQAIMERPDILLLDEPTNALDDSGIEIMENIIREYKAKGKLVIITSHDKEFLNSICDLIYTIKSGSIVNEEHKNEQK